MVFGGALGFAGCSIAGHLVPETMEPFSRFHLYVAPDTLYRPTVRSVWNMVQARVADRSKAVVIVGGSSVPYGLGQRMGHTFAEQLGEELGPDYVVINLAMRSGDVAGIAMFIAESLQAQGRKVFYIADVNWGGAGILTGANPYYAYMYWQYRGEPFAHSWQPRKEFAARDAMSELALGQRLNTLFRFENLWTYIAHNVVGTIYTRYTPDFWRPRREYADNEIEHPPYEIRNPEIEAAAVANLAKGNFEADLRSALASFTIAIPDNLRSTTILLMCRKNPLVVALLPIATQQEIARRYQEMERQGRGAGLHILQGCRDSVPADYVDTSHLSVAGARHLASAVAAEIAQLR
jgi:hypothetical protein